MRMSPNGHCRPGWYLSRLIGLPLVGALEWQPPVRRFLEDTAAAVPPLLAYTRALTPPPNLPSHSPAAWSYLCERASIATKQINSYYITVYHSFQSSPHGSRYNPSTDTALLSSTDHISRHSSFLKSPFYFSSFSNINI